MELYRIKQNKLYFPVAFLVTILSFLLIPEIALADGGQSSGIDTILRSDSLEGNDHMRYTIAGYLNKPISFIITIAGFLIITFTFLKFALTLLYLTAPDIFDRIHIYKTQHMQGGFKGKTPVDMISYIFALILPDVKALTDYSKEGNEIDQTPLDYLKKNLPKIMLFIIIGAMIFDGQARNFIAKAADVGMLFANIIDRHDTVGAVENFIDTADRYVFVYDTSTQAGKNEEKIAKAVQRHLHGLHPGINDPTLNQAIGTLSEKVTEKLKIEMEKQAKTAGIKSFGEIVGFNLSITKRSQASAVKDGNKPGIFIVKIDEGEYGSSGGSIVAEGTEYKYMVIRYSHLVDKDNRNFLFKATTSTVENKQ